MPAQSPGDVSFTCAGTGRGDRAVGAPHVAVGLGALGRLSGQAWLSLRVLGPRLAQYCVPVFHFLFSFIISEIRINFKIA
jgi:hypothetical protein